MVLQFDNNGRVIIPCGVKKQKEMGPDTFILNIRGINYFFDKEGRDRFNREFNPGGLAYPSKKEYLVRRNGGKKEYFHRWIMQKELEDYCRENNLREIDVEVHHLNNNKDNRKRFLVCMEKEDHKDLHVEEKAWKGYRKRMSQYWRKDKTEEYYRAQFHHSWCLSHKR